jgi:hypothetical protein
MASTDHALKAKAQAIQKDTPVSTPELVRRKSFNRAISGNSVNPKTIVQGTASNSTQLTI